MTVKGLVAVALTVGAVIGAVGVIVYDLVTLVRGYPNDD